MKKSVVDAINVFIKENIFKVESDEEVKALLISKHYNNEWEGELEPLNEVSTVELMEYLLNEYKFPENSNKPTKYLKVWQGEITGSFAGRYDGFFEEKYQIYDSIESLATEFGRHSGEEYYELKAVSNSDIAELVDKERAKQNKNNKITKEIYDEIDKLKNKIEQIEDEDVKEEVKEIISKLSKIE